MSTPQQLMAMVNDAVGKDAVRMASHQSLKVTYTPTGLLPMDILLQGGMPSGRFVELYGDYSTLKSYIGLNLIREYQERGKVAAVIDTERTFDPDWAIQVGVNVDDLIIWPNRDDEQIHTGEEAMDVTQALVRGGVDFTLFDSIAAALPQAEASKRLAGENVQPARLAMLMSTALRRITSSNSHTAILFTNQTRVNLGITFGSNEAIPGGKAPAFYASYRIRVQKVGKVTRDDKTFDGEKWQNGKTQIGQKFKAEVTKSKLSRPFRDINFTWDMTTGGIDLVSFLIAQGVEIGLVQIKGNTWSCGSVKAVGREKFKQALSTNPVELRVLEERIREHHQLPAMTKQIKTAPGTQRRTTSRSTSAGSRRAPASKKALVRRG